MLNIVKAEVKIRGVRPYFFHQFTRESIPLERKEKTGKAGNDPIEWTRTVAVNWETRQLYVKSSQVFACIRDGARYIKKGRGSIQKDVIAVLLVESPEEIYIEQFLPEEPLPEDKSLPVYLDVRGVVNPSTRGRNVRYRVAMSPGWELTFTISWDKTVVATNSMQAVLIDAGRMCGIGNGRSIGMGRFEIVSFEVLET